jgi:hypothetical protein
VGNSYLLSFGQVDGLNTVKPIWKLAHCRLKDNTFIERTKFRQTIHLSVAEIKSFSPLSAKKDSHLRHTGCRAPCGRLSVNIRSES